jgi:hypothetical protein
MGPSVLGRPTTVDAPPGGGTHRSASTGRSPRSAPGQLFLAFVALVVAVVFADLIGDGVQNAVDAPWFAQASSGSGYRAVFEPTRFLVFFIPWPEPS